MAKSPLTDCTCLHCGQPLTQAQRKRMEWHHPECDKDYAHDLMMWKYGWTDNTVEWHERFGKRLQ